METVRKGYERDLPQVKELWNECFGEDEFAEWFFARLYCEEFLRVYEVDGEIVSMAFCFPKTLIVQGKEYRAWYLYGIGTKTESRGHGFAKRLISACVSEAKGRGMELCFLIPAEQSLFSYYRTCGFDLAWTRAEETCVETRSSSEITIDSTNDFTQVNAIYERVWDGYLKRTEREWELLSEEFRMADGNLYLLKREQIVVGYCFAMKEADVLKIRELGLLQSEKTDAVCHALAHTLHAKTWNLTHPGEGTPFAAVLPFAEELRSVGVFINCDLLHN
ncbi:MAG: GNAT family N-acetyltransferase [Ruminococcaceae bacterium]|nr:GNAT family N-acetyltransferase [Oscillospiraceae bacterium]